METLTTNPSDSTEAAGPRWVLLNRHNDNDSYSSADPKTIAASCTSSGLTFTVSFSVAAPPAACSLHVGWVGDDCKDSNDPELEVIAAHDDAVLIKIRVPASDSYTDGTLDYFLYEAGGGRTPLLSLLPSRYVSMQCQRAEGTLDVPTLTSRMRHLGGGTNGTGILRRGDREVLVAQLEVGYDAPYGTAELCVLRSGAPDWVLRRVPIVHHEGEGVLVRDWTDVDAAVAVCSRFMCWVDYLSGILLWDVAEEDESTKLRYVPLPPETRRHEYNEYYKDRHHMQYCRNLAATGPNAVRLVSIAPRCSGGGPGKTSCERSSFAFNVMTWTLTLTTEEPMVWVKDGVLDCDELWQLAKYSRLPRVAPQLPIVSSDDPDIICFVVCENYYYIDNADETVWMVEINTRSKVLLSVVRSDKEDFSAGGLLPAKLNW